MSENNHFENPQPFSPRKRVRSFGYAFRGIFYMIRTQHNFWIQMTIGILTLALGFLFKISPLEWGQVLLCMGMVLAAETFNSAVEALTDALHPEHDPRIGRVKDLAAGAVLIAALAAAGVGIVIFLPKIIALV